MSPSRDDLPSSCPKSYHFQCKVTNSARLVWKVNGEEKLRLTRNSNKTNVLFSEDSLNIYVQTIMPETTEYYASYVSMLWFDSSIVGDTINVTCEGYEEGDTVVDTVVVEKNGNYNLSKSVLWIRKQVVRWYMDQTWLVCQ